MVVNLVVGGDYGFLNKPPLVGSFGQPLNYLIASDCYRDSNSLNREISRKFLQQKIGRIDSREDLK